MMTVLRKGELLPTPNQSFSVGKWQVEPHLNLIKRDSDSLALRPQVMNLLVYLAKNAGEVVSTDDLLDQVWGDVVVSSGSVYNCINELRRGLKDDPQQPTYIETVSKRGYRLIAPVSWHTEDAAGASTHVEQRPPGIAAPVPASKGSPARRWLLPGLVLIVLAVLLLRILDEETGGSEKNEGRTPGAIESLAVLPIRDIGSEREDWWSDGMTAALITELSRLDNLRVISHTSVQPFKSRDSTLSEIAERLGVDAVLDGSVTRNSDYVAMRISMVRTDDERTLWTRDYQAEPEDILHLQMRVASAVAAEVDVAVVAIGGAESTPVAVVDPKAYDALLQGEYLWRNGEGRVAIERLRRAIQIDQNFALGWATLAEAYLAFSLDDPTWVEAARVAARRALELDAAQPAARATLAGIALYRDWDWPAARQGLTEVLTLNPGYHNAHQLLGDYYEFLGDWDNAIAQGIRSTKVSPGDVSMLLNLGITYIFAGRYPQAEQVCREALRLRDSISFAYRCIAEARKGQGDITGGLELLEKAVELAPDNQPLMAQQAIFYMEAGQPQRARDVLRQLDQQQREGAYVSPLIRGMVYMALGETKRALDWIETALEEKAPWTPGIMAWPYFNPLRGNARFEALIQRIEEFENGDGTAKLTAPGKQSQDEYL